MGGAYKQTRHLALKNQKWIAGQNKYILRISESCYLNLCVIAFFWLYINQSVSFSGSSPIVCTFGAVLHLQQQKTNG